MEANTKVENNLEIDSKTDNMPKYCNDCKVTN